MKNIILVFLCSLLIIGCKEKISDGIISKMSYRPPYEYSYVSLIPAGKFMIPITHYVNVPDTTFYIEIYKIVDGDTSKAEFTVSGEDFYLYNYGDHISFLTE